MWYYPNGISILVGFEGNRETLTKEVVAVGRKVVIVVE
jgi:hypothetical protein